MPAIYDLANRGLLPPGFALVGFARRDWADEDFAEVVHDAVREHSRTPFRQEVWDRLAEGLRFVQGTFDDDEAFDRLAACVAELDDRARHRRQPRVLPLDPAVGLPHRVQAALALGPGRRRGRRVAPRGDREAVRPRPALGAGAQRDRQRRLPRGRGLPHRPLPRQGDRPEPAGPAVRQRALRADLERPPRRPRADHDGRGHRRRRSRGLLRRHRRGPRRHPEPPAAAARADGDGGAGLLLPRRPARGEDQGPLGREARRAAGRDHRARAVRRAGGRGRRGQGPAAGGRLPAPTRSPRPTRRSPAR